MATLELTNVILTLGLVGISGGFAYITNKVGAIAVWGFSSIFVVTSLTFGFNQTLIMGLIAMSFIVSVITVVIDG